MHEMALGLTYLRAIEATGGMPVVIPPLRIETDRAAARPARGHLPVRRPRPPPGRLRPGAGRAPRPDRARPRPLRARDRERRRPARHADPRDLPRDPGAQRRPRRDPRPAPSRSSTRREAVPHRQGIPGNEPSHPVDDRSRQPARGDGRRERDRRQLVPPPGDRPARPRPRRDSVGRRTARSRRSRIRSRASCSGCSGTQSCWSTVPRSRRSSAGSSKPPRVQAAA